MSLINAVYAYNGNIVGAGGNTVFTVGDGGEEPLSLRMSFNNETPANADGTIYLEANDSAYDGIYDIMWGDANGVMSNYSKIDSVSLAVSDKKPMAFVKMMPFNAIPKYATRICAVKNNEIVASFDIPSAKLWASGNYGEHLYSFGLLSDVHVQYETGHNDVEVAMTYLNERESVDAICISGDLTSDGSVAHMEEWKTDRDTWADNTPVYSCNGNHEAYNNSSIMKTNPDTIRKYLDSDYTESTGDPYFYKVINNDVFVFVPIYEGLTASISAAMFSEDCLSWLEGILEQYRNQRVFLFAHVPPHSKYTQYDGFGTGNLAYSYDIWGYGSAMTEKNTFLSLLEHYKNVIWFSGHSHIKYEYQKLWEFLNVTRYKNGAKFVHVSSLTVPRDIVDGSVTDVAYAESEGAVVDVYTNVIRVRCRNFVGGKFLGFNEYIIDTTPVIIPPSAKTVVSISATKTKTQYYTNESLSTDDIVVTALYSDNSSEVVSNNCIFNTSNVNLSTVGTYSIGVSYTYEGDTVTTSVQVVSTERITRYVPILDASFVGTLTGVNQWLTPTSNNETTEIGNHYAGSNAEILLNKPLYYRIISSEGLDAEKYIGFVGGISPDRYDGHVVDAIDGYTLSSTDWAPLYKAGDTSVQLSTGDINSYIDIGLKSKSDSSATFPVNVNARIQIGYAVDMTLALDVSYTGTLTARGQSAQPTIIGGKDVQHSSIPVDYTSSSDLYNKPLWYRLIGTQGVDTVDKVGYLGFVGKTVYNPDVSHYMQRYLLDSTEWVPLMAEDDPTLQLQTDSVNKTLATNFKAKSDSTATFPVTINTRIQIAY